MTGVSGKIHLNGERVLTFLYISSQPPFRFEPDYVIRKPRWVVSNDILSERKYSQLFTHESNIFVKTVIGQIDLPTPRAVMMPQYIYRLVTDKRTDGIKHHNISEVHCVHLADIIGLKKNNKKA